ncbi:hypothetical protein [Alteraurantiacibacter aquimixticola]|uniref:Uncharacterized protein n=1 Tax=Alteraurantiacibacter aquimixticola TaxID=2489173 RepID=A0A4T3F3Z5_9SPHN|nr:hypothetical protein [Alteraurantiacibacter aquimixticola]TIX49423.1 hypothetical protein E5222_11230 [Alteraurantiacibacter aquimixticola]
MNTRRVSDWQAGLAAYAAAAAKLAAASAIGFTLFLGLAVIGAGSQFDTVFYRGVVLIAAACLLLFLAMIAVNRRWQLFSPDLVVAAIATTFSLSIGFLIVFPVTVDRSITVYLLSHMDRHAESSFTTGELQAEFQRTYLTDWEQIARRMEEQTTTGNIIEVAPGRFRITPQGQAMAGTFRRIAAAFDTDPRFVGDGPAQGVARKTQQ